MNKYFKLIVDPDYRLTVLSRFWFVKNIDDEKYLKKKYKYALKRDLDLNNPRRFDEKLQWLKLNDRNPLYTDLVDKLAVKDIVAKEIGEKHIIPTLGVWDKFEEIDFDKLPDKFVLKCTHNSGGYVVCDDKSKFDFKKAKKFLNKNLKTNFFYHGREWPYKDIQPRIIAEKFLEEELIDYKFFCFNGEVKLLHTCTDREKGDLCIDFFDLDWNHLELRRKGCKNAKSTPKKPKNLEKMIEFAGVLSKGKKFSRIDFYEVDGEVYFGEITFYPACGFKEFEPDKWNLKLGEMLDINSI